MKKRIKTEKRETDNLAHKNHHSNRLRGKDGPVEGAIKRGTISMQSNNFGRKKCTLKK